MHFTQKNFLFIYKICIEDKNMEKWKFLSDIAKEKGYNQNSLAKALNWSQVRFSNLFNGKQDIPAKRVYDFAEFFDLDYKELKEYNDGQRITLPSRKSAKKDIINIDILDVKACCGSGNEIVEENVICSWCMPNDMFKHISSSAPHNIKMIQVFGDSMQPTLKAGDWVLVDITHNVPDTDGLFVIWLTTGLAVKRIQGGLNNLIVHSDNPQYRDITASPEEIKIVGKVVYILKSERVG